MEKDTLPQTNGVTVVANRVISVMYVFNLFSETSSTNMLTFTSAILTYRTVLIGMICLRNHRLLVHTMLVWVLSQRRTLHV